jgi:hypothetical protein
LFALAACARGQIADACVDATEADTGTVYLFDTGAASQDGSASCATTQTPDVWFKRTPGLTGYLIIESCSASTIVLSAHNSCSGAPESQIACTTQYRVNSLGCNYAGSPFFTFRLFVVPVTAGVPVWIRVARDVVDSNGATTNGKLKISEMPVAPNDACANASTIVDGDHLTFDTASATYAAEGTSSCVVGPSPNAPDLWYKYTAVHSGNATVQVANTAANLAPLVSIHPSCGAASTYCGRANWDQDGSPPTGPITATYGAQVTFPVTVGTTYYIRVMGGSDMTFPGFINLTLVANPPANDTCNTAADIILPPSNTDSYAFDMTGATNSSLANCNTVAANNNFDVWFRYLPNQTGTAIFSACRGYPAPPGTVPVQLVAYSDCNGSSPICGTDEVCVTYPTIDGSRAWLSVPVQVGVPVFVRIATAFGETGTGTLLATLLTAPPNDLCANAANVTPGDYSYSTFSATQDRTATCNYSGTDTAADVWFQYVPAADGIAVINTCADTAVERLTTTLTAYHTCNGPELLGCDSRDLEDLCWPTLNGLQVFGRQGILRLKARAGEPILIRIASADSKPDGVPRRGTRGMLHIAQDPADGRWFEGNTPRSLPDPLTPPQPDSGPLPATAQVAYGTGMVTQILPAITVNDRADMFKINICDPEHFRAQVVNNDPTSSLSFGQIFLFDAQGYGVSFAHTYLYNQQYISSQFVQPRGAGVYYLAVAPRTMMPVDSTDDAPCVDCHSIWYYNWQVGQLEAAPDGPAAGNPVMGWSRFLDGDVTQCLRYTLALTGVCAFCHADFNASGQLSVQDIFDFLNAWFAGDPRSDYNEDGTVAVQDIFDFLNAWFAGC